MNRHTKHPTSASSVQASHKGKTQGKSIDARKGKTPSQPLTPNKDKTQGKSPHFLNGKSQGRYSCPTENEKQAKVPRNKSQGRHSHLDEDKKQLQTLCDKARDWSSYPTQNEKQAQVLRDKARNRHSYPNGDKKQLRALCDKERDWSFYPTENEKQTQTLRGKTQSRHSYPTENKKQTRELPGKAQGRLVCQNAKRCGGCSFINEDYAEQLKQKDQMIRELFQDVCPPELIFPIKGMEEPFHYRNKVISPFVPAASPSAKKQKGAKQENAKRGTAKPGASSKPKANAASAHSQTHILTGMYAKGTHALINTDGCMVENEQANRVIRAVRRIMERHHMQAYNEDTGQGFMRHAVVRVGHQSGEMLVTLVTNDETFTASKAFCKELVRECPFVTSVVQNINTRQTNVILGEKERVLYGPGFILDTLCGLSFRISSHSFYQVNAVQTEVLYRTAIEAAGLSGVETVIDAYCGTGTIGLVAAAGLSRTPNAHTGSLTHSANARPQKDKTGQTPDDTEAAAYGEAASQTGNQPNARCVIGVDKVSAAIKDARQNAQHNGIKNAQFICADATQFLQELANGGESSGVQPDPESPLVLLMDPPRSGSTPAFLHAAASLSPTRIVYISCNPQTQVRDIALLKEEGYRIQSVQPVDMFPHTPHVETVCLLSKVR